MISHLPPGMRVSITVHRPKAAFRSGVSSFARLVIHTHQNVSSRSNAVILASSPGSRSSSILLRTCDCELCTRAGSPRGGSFCVGSNKVVGADWLFSSAKPDERKSAQEGVVGRPKSVTPDRGPFRRPENSRVPVAVDAPPLVLVESSKSPENPKSSKRDQDGSGVVGPGDVTDWFAEAMASNTLRHSSVSAFTVSS